MRRTLRLPAKILLLGSLLGAAQGARAGSEPAVTVTKEMCPVALEDSGGPEPLGSMASPLDEGSGFSPPVSDLRPSGLEGFGADLRRPTSVAAQASDRETSAFGSDRTWSRVNLFKRVWSDQRFLVSRWWPGEFRNRGFTYPLMSGVLLAAASNYEDSPFDQGTVRSVHQRTSGRSLSVAHGLTRLGNGSVSALFLGSSWLIGRLSGNDRLNETASLSAEALADAGIWVTVIKSAAARARPSDNGSGDFFQYRTQPGQDNSSFPSGHAMGAFALATVFAHQYADKKWVPWVAYGTASLISASRVAVARHYPSDVIVGGVLGNSIGRMVLARAHGEESQPPGGRIGPIFDPSGHGFGVGYSYTWPIAPAPHR